MTNIVLASHILPNYFTLFHEPYFSTNQAADILRISDKYIYINIYINIYFLSNIRLTHLSVFLSFFSFWLHRKNYFWVSGFYFLQTTWFSKSSFPVRSHSFPMHPFSTPWKHQEVEKGWIGNKWVTIKDLLVTPFLTNFPILYLLKGV